MTADLPTRLRERACGAGEPWTGDDPSGDHGHTDCWLFHLAADVLDAIDKLHHKVYGQAGPLPYCESCGDTHLWPCPTHRLLHPEEGT